MRFLIFQTEGKRKEKPKQFLQSRGSRAVFLVVIISLIGILSSLIGRSLTRLSDTPSISLIYRNYWDSSEKFKIINFQTQTHTLASQDRLVLDYAQRSPDNQWKATWVCENEDCVVKPLTLSKSEPEMEDVEPSTINYRRTLDWSPDGKWLVFSAFSDGHARKITPENAAQREIWMMNAQTEELIQLTSNHGLDWDPSFSPDGSQIVYISDAGERASVSILDLSSGESHSIAQSSYSSFPMWSPDGEWIAFEIPYAQASELIGTSHIAIIRIDGSEFQQVTYEPSRLVGWEAPGLIRTP